MINILSYVGMNMQSEVCLWCLLGLVRTIFDATLFKVNANLKQVWQMTMPEELTMPVQRVLRTMVSGIMLVQCFTVYVYLASYIVLLYPVFLEERPTLVLPWLLLAAIRKLLCELTSLALGLGTCVLLGPARPPCIKFVVVKFTSIMPAFYMWMLVFSYYHALKVASAFKTFPAVLPPNDNDYGLELAVRRRRTKSLLGEEQLRKKLVANFYGERSSSITNETHLRPVMELSSRNENSPERTLEEVEAETETDANRPLTVSTTGWSEIGAYEDWFGSEVMIPRDTDRILEQIVLMLLRIGAFLKKEGLESIIDSQILNSAVPTPWHERDNIDCATMNADDTDTPPLVGSSKGNMASYLREYPQIFMKKQSTDVPQTECTLASLKTVHSHVESEEGNTSKNRVKHDSSNENISLEVENIASKKKISISDKDGSIDEQKLPRQLKSKSAAKVEGTKLKSTLKKHRDSESQSKDNAIVNKMTNDQQNSKISSEDNKKEYMCKTSNEEINEFTDYKISNDDKNKTNGILSQADKNTVHIKLSENVTNNVAAHMKISNEKDSKEMLHSTTLNEGSIKEVIENTIPSEDKDKKYRDIKTSDQNQHENFTCNSVDSENNDKKLTQNDTPYVLNNSNELKHSNALQIKDSIDRKKSNEELTHSQNLDIMKNIGSTYGQISKDSKDAEIMDASPLSNLDGGHSELHEGHSKILNEIKNEDSEQSNEDKNKEVPHIQIENVRNDNDPTNNIILNQLIEDIYQHLEQNSTETVNSEIKQQPAK